MNSFHNSVKYLRLFNIKSAINIVKECQPKYLPVNKSLSNPNPVVFAPRSINLKIIDKRIENRIKQDPTPYIPIVNPRSILPLIDSNWRKDEIGLPSIKQEEIQAARLIVIRRKKMKKHQRRKLWKRMRHRWARIKQHRRIAKEKVFQNELLAMVKEANNFSAEKYVAEKLEKVNQIPLLTTDSARRAVGSKNKNIKQTEA